MVEPSDSEGRFILWGMWAFGQTYGTNRPAFFFGFSLSTTDANHFLLGGFKHIFPPYLE
jgi:hypothetical protein